MSLSMPSLLTAKPQTQNLMPRIGQRAPSAETNPQQTPSKQKRRAITLHTAMPHHDALNPITPRNPSPINSKRSLQTYGNSTMKIRAPPSFARFATSIQQTRISNLLQDLQNEFVSH
ncbi:hypothetical protein M758_4G108400 [Ceratodon purpureus]|nr:hypothetical protein M758_4G108400 [Ceratodon purpureus]